jgi:hypothetical protein
MEHRFWVELRATWLGTEYERGLETWLGLETKLGLE